MKTILDYIYNYVKETNKLLLILVTLLTTVFIFINYHFGMDEAIRKNSFGIKLLAWYGVNAAAFWLPYLFTRGLGLLKSPMGKQVYLLLLIAPLIFALKLALDLEFRISEDPERNNFWNHVLYWPMLAGITTCILYLVWKWQKYPSHFYGLSTRGLKWKPYFLMLLIMIPLLSLASTRPEFQEAYPRIRSILGFDADIPVSFTDKLLFELSYGSDFFTIELFFRGFIILAFVRWAGPHAILPMACFYCTIHFGKPLAECISSFFGGMILGILVYHTRSILGGLAVHLGIAWLMEIAGYCQM
ncbi:MAG: CPBP family intramembrane glutamic endopeptidase [Chitinophagaceae bacterium]